MSNLSIALIGMSAKPFHSGHASLIKIASQQQDVVHVFTSLTPRGSSQNGEYEISSEKMKRFWNELVLANLPLNVQVTFTKNPISSIYEELAEPLDNCSYHIYAGDDAFQRSFLNIQKYTSLKIDENLFVHSVTRDTLSEASGTDCRKALFNNDFAAFTKLMPWYIDAQQAWNILRT
jgi:hypothetical protein